MNELVKRLTSGPQQVVMGAANATLEDLQRRVTEIGYVFVRFPSPSGGGTEIGMRLDPEETDVAGADFQAGAGTVHVAGSITLDSVPVRCVVDIDLATLTGTGLMLVREESAV